MVTSYHGSCSALQKWVVRHFVCVPEVLFQCGHVIVIMMDGDEDVVKHL